MALPSPVEFKASQWRQSTIQSAGKSATANPSPVRCRRLSESDATAFRHGSSNALVDWSPFLLPSPVSPPPPTLQSERATRDACVQADLPLAAFKSPNPSDAVPAEGGTVSVPPKPTRYDQIVTFVCGALVGAAAWVCAPALWPTSTLIVNQFLLAVPAGLCGAGAVALLPQLPARLCGATFGGLVGAALAIACAPCMAPSYLAGVALVSAVFGYKASQHMGAITVLTMGSGALAALWWAAGIVGPRFGIAVPPMRWAA